MKKTFQEANPQWNELYPQIEPDFSEDIRRYYFIDDKTYALQQRHKVSVNYERLSYMAWMLNWNYTARIGPYENLIMPQKQIPQNMEVGSREHALWLFYNSLEMRSAQKSMDTFGRQVKMYEMHPEVYDPVAVSSGRVDIGHIFEDTQIFQQKKPYKLIESWENNSRILLEKEPSGDPRALIQDAQDYEELCRILDVDHYKLPKGTYFNGFGHKVASLFLSWSQQFGWMKNDFPYPIPVDLHVFRIFGVTESFKILGDHINHEPLRTILRAYFYQFAKDNFGAIDQRHLSEAIWHLGRLYCSKNPQAKEVNDSRRYKARQETRKNLMRLADELPFVEMMINQSFPEHFRPEPGTPIPPSSDNMFGKCTGCPIDEECNWIMSSSQHYDKGKVAIKRRRIKNMQTRMYVK